MPQFIHLTDQRTVPKIRKNGITVYRVRGISPKARGVYAMPVTPNHFLTHQWLRELKRAGIRTITAIQFRLEDDTPVTVGRYDMVHLATTAAEAVRIFQEHETGLGLEVIVGQSIPPRSITRIYTPPQVAGWRYYPNAHADKRKPCGCRYCQRGQINNRKLRASYEAGIKSSG